MNTATVRQAIVAYLGRLTPGEPGRIGDVADALRGRPLAPGVTGMDDPTWCATRDELRALRDEGIVGWGHVGGWRLMT